MATKTGTKTPEQAVQDALSGIGAPQIPGSTSDKPSITGNPKGSTPSGVSPQALAAGGSSPGSSGLTNKSKPLINAPVIGVDAQGNPIRSTKLAEVLNDTYAGQYLASKTPEQRSALQKKMVALGLYPANYTPTYGYVSSGGQDEAALNGLLIVGINKGIGDVDKMAEAAAKDATLLQLAKQGAGISTSAGTKSITSLDAAAVDLNNSFMDFFNVKANKAEIQAYAGALNAAEKKSKTALTTEQRKEILLNAVGQKATSEYNLAVGGDAKSQAALTDGIIGKNYRTLKSVYADNGVPIDDKTLYKQAVQSLRGQNTYDNIVGTINIQAKTQFPALAQYIDQGKTVKDILNPYMQLKSQILEVPIEQIKVSDLTNVASDPTKLMSIADYKSTLYSDPAWKKTKNYMDTTMSDAHSLLSMMGLR
jgi:hypothetical protein